MGKKIVINEEELEEALAAVKKKREELKKKIIQALPAWKYEKDGYTWRCTLQKGKKRGDRIRVYCLQLKKTFCVPLDGYAGIKEKIDHETNKNKKESN